MDIDSNMARDIRAMTERLGEYADEYTDIGMSAEADEFEEVREALGRLHRLPDPEDRCPCGASLADGEGYDGYCGNCADRREKDEYDDDDPDGAVDFEPSPDPNWMNP